MRGDALHSLLNRPRRPSVPEAVSATDFFVFRLRHGHDILDHDLPLACSLRHFKRSFPTSPIDVTSGLRPARRDLDARRSIDALIAGMKGYERGFVYLAPPETYLLPEFFPCVTARFKPGTEVLSLAALLMPDRWWVDGGTPCGEIFTSPEGITHAQVAEASQRLPSLADPLTLLGCYVFRVPIIQRILEKLQQATDWHHADTLLREMLAPSGRVFALEHLCDPLVVHPVPQNAEILRRSLVDAISQRDLPRSRTMISSLSRSGILAPPERRLGIIVSALGGDMWGARLEARACVKEGIADPETTELLKSLESHLGDDPPSYDNIHGSIDSVPGYMIPGQEKLLFTLVKHLRDDAVVVEIGSHLGRSTVAMAFGCVGSRRRIIALDPWNGPSGHRDVFEYHLARLGLLQYVTPVQGFSRDLLPTSSVPQGIDMVFIDGSHHYHDVADDFMLAYPKIRNGGWIAFHDVAPSSCGPWRVWNETAKHMLLNIHYASSLACGQKDEGNFPAVIVPRPFCYADDWIAAMAARSEFAGLIHHLNLLRSAQLAEHETEILESEVGQALTGEVFEKLKEYLADDPMPDPSLRYWGACGFFHQGHRISALRHLDLGIPHASGVLAERMVKLRHTVAQSIMPLLG